MRSNVGRETSPEARLRRALEQHIPGEFTANFRIEEGSVRCTVDFVSVRARVCVFVDGCFWHACRQHFHPPHSNTAWWQEKAADNVRRDRTKTRALRATGWRVIRVWEHSISTE